MLRAAPGLAACLAATPVAAQQQIACVPGEREMTEASAQHGETLQWSGVSQSKTPFWFFASFRDQTWTVWFQLPNGNICTAPNYVGVIHMMGSEPA